MLAWDVDLRGRLTMESLAEWLNWGLHPPNPDNLEIRSTKFETISKFKFSNVLNSEERAVRQE